MERESELRGDNPAVPFSSNDQDVIARLTGITLSTIPAVKNIDCEFDVALTLEWINSHGFKRVALQFPDELMSFSVDIFLQLQNQTSAEIVILADTSYGSCCVDEIAAEHYCCDAIVHYGHACLSPTPGRIPVKFIFGHKSFDISKCVQHLTEMIDGDQSRPVLLFYDTVYFNAVKENLAESLRSLLPNLIVSELCLPEDENDLTSPAVVVGKHTCYGRMFTLPRGCSSGDCVLLYIGAPDSKFLTAALMTLNHMKCVCYNPDTGLAVSDFWQPGRLLARRYYLVERARDAQRVGILVGTLGVADYLDVCAKLEAAVRRAGKSVYRFVVGKLNVAKLANFAEIDVFVLVACCENSLLDSKEFYRPIVTPFEMEIACDSSRQWTGNYELDFRQLFTGELLSDDSSIDKRQPDVSLVTGKVRLRGHEAVKLFEVDNQQQLVVRHDSQLVAANSAGSFFVDRSFQGLDPQLGQTPVSKAIDGACGIAAGYQHEPLANECCNSKCAANTCGISTEVTD